MRVVIKVSSAEFVTRKCNLVAVNVVGRFVAGVIVLRIFDIVL